MEKYIASFIASKGVVAVLGFEKVVSRATYLYYEFMGKDDRFYVFSILYDSHRIWGTLEGAQALQLTSGGKTVAVGVQEGMLDVLEKFLRVYNDKDEFNDNRAKKITKDELDMFLAPYYNSMKNKLSNVSLHNFSVQKVVDNGTFFTIYFTLLTRMELPIKLNIGEPSVVVRRDYLKYSKPFEHFVEKLGEITGEIIWR